ncbi:hypothetical protein SISNIDRAFT_118887 [Sistotremastrum niveocremeum HHB9708]|uniref:Uncharacterized protein n=2 Tax=Sistotremastraceae TaxID=3402574 RepID=A0A164TQ14_9AGAM|nr:hypothetical protein SISNIDRAFT_118887 [Sistotremastrum niveocremeum HHB9708]KZT42215.1 hypothetical protein SISSUDRAFT_114044 [Sistotremastrum suecicum HHB10207 ss-3]
MSPDHVPNSDAIVSLEVTDRSRARSPGRRHQARVARRSRSCSRSLSPRRTRSCSPYRSRRHHRRKSGSREMLSARRRSCSRESGQTSRHRRVAGYPDNALEEQHGHPISRQPRRDSFSSIHPSESASNVPDNEAKYFTQQLRAVQDQ